MKIIFLCGCLEPGKDGVGDYTRRLAGELMRQGHNVALLGLNDPHTGDVLEENQIDNSTTIAVLRIPATLPSESRFKLAKPWVNKFSPDWISLQYVPFAFHPKGLDIKLAKNLYNLGKGYKWEVMFHELWVGMEKNAAKKLKIWGKVQKILIVTLLKNLKDRVIHTQIALYKKHIKLLGFDASILPLYSNIPVIVDDTIQKDAGKLILLIFGSIYPATNSIIEALAGEAVAYGKQHNLAVQLLMVGRCGKEQNLWSDIWLNKGIDVAIMGEQSVAVISQTMQRATIGIATTPAYLIGKSGTVAAMLEHQLPVINIAEKWQPDISMELELPVGVINYEGNNLKQIFLTPPPNNSNLQSVSKQFAASLDESDKLKTA